MESERERETSEGGVNVFGCDDEGGDNDGEAGADDVETQAHPAIKEPDVPESRGVSVDFFEHPADQKR